METEKSKAQKKIDLLQNLKTDIKDLEKQINSAKYEGIKIAGIKSLNVFKHIGVGLLPIIITSGITIGAGALITGGGLPFVARDINQPANFMEEFDSRASYRQEKHYSNLSQNNQLLVYTNWTLNENGLYQRQVDRYNFKKYTKEDILAVLDSGDLEKVSDIIGEPYTYTESKNELADKETQENDKYIQATLYYVNGDDFTVVKESSDSVSGRNILEMFIILLVGGIATFCVWCDDGYDPIYRIREDLRETKSKVDVKTLRKQLQTRKDNLNRLSE